jgi:hypothetical protein
LGSVDIFSRHPVESVSIAGVLTKADGRVVDLGTLSYWHRNPLRRVAWHLRQKVRWLMLSPELGATVVVNGGHAIVTNRITGAGTEPKYIGVGTAAGTAAAADTTLFTETAADLSTTSGTRVTGTSSRTTTTQTNDTYTVVGTLTATGAGSVTNAGLWDNATIGSGNLYVKGDFTSVGMAVSDTLQLTFNVKFS